MAVSAAVPAAVARFLGAPTPVTWARAAVESLDLLLTDHANCELKAASTALAFIYRYPERTSLVQRMSRLAREELRHYEQVRRLMEKRAIPFRRLSASRYAVSLRSAARDAEPQRLLDMLLVAALIEARSCERFALLVPRLPGDIGEFYAGLLASEARHFENYLELARRQTGAVGGEVDGRLRTLCELEAELATSPDTEFRFHSGVPAGGTAGRAPS